MTANNRNMAITIIVIVVVALLGFYFMNQPDRRTPGEKIGDAVDEVSEGFENAGDKLQNKTPAEKMGDAVEEAGDDVKDAIDR